MGSELFVAHIINKPAIKAQVVIAISNQLQREKDGYVINRAVVEECVDVFLNLEAFKKATAGERYAESVLPQQGQGAEPPTSSYDAAEILRLIHRSVFATMVPPTDDEDDSNPLSNTGSEYSFAPSRTDTTDYGIYARRMALSQVTFQTDFADDG
ncbi:hypothetical protein CPB84DRAFT_1809673 [Gymnopilus junonius]|uniref:Uncharacterized protein n=1 Tax=Gymnopilus junonius TaxID=109634 RepID=A0A9P5N6M3_GYMJU|nr:hypothetical protein CPB84DRAFT_1809673 [Gymnopilus junonius]